MRLRNVKGSREKIAENEYVIHHLKTMPGKWRSLWKEEAPLHIEIGMGKGQFLLGLSEVNPDIHYIGMERYSSVMYRVLQKLEETPRENVRLICHDATFLSDMFAPGELDRIYLNFSDPWPKDRHAKRRLTSDRFLPIYDRVLAKGGTLEFKTDNRDLFDYSVETIREYGWEIPVLTYDLHADPKLNEGNILTEYEETFSAKGNPICKLIACRKSD